MCLPNWIATSLHPILCLCIKMLIRKFEKCEFYSRVRINIKDCPGRHITEVMQDRHWNCPRSHMHSSLQPLKSKVESDHIPSRVCLFSVIFFLFLNIARRPIEVIQVTSHTVKNAILNDKVLVSLSS